MPHRSKCPEHLCKNNNLHKTPSIRLQAIFFFSSAFASPAGQEAFQRISLLSSLFSQSQIAQGTKLKRDVQILGKLFREIHVSTICYKGGYEFHQMGRLDPGPSARSWATPCSRGGGVAETAPAAQEEKAKEMVASTKEPPPSTILGTTQATQLVQTKREEGRQRSEEGWQGCLQRSQLQGELFASSHNKLTVFLFCFFMQMHMPLSCSQGW